MPFSDRLIRNEDVVRMAGGARGKAHSRAEGSGISRSSRRITGQRRSIILSVRISRLPTPFRQPRGLYAIAMNELPVTIDGASVLVVGYGRIGKLLAAKLKSLGANVTASARRDDDIAWIKASGINSARTGKLDETIARIRPDVIFTTVPHIGHRKEGARGVRRRTDNRPRVKAGRRRHSRGGSARKARHMGAVASGKDVACDGGKDNRGHGCDEDT